MIRKTESPTKPVAHAESFDDLRMGDAVHAFECRDGTCHLALVVEPNPKTGVLRLSRVATAGAWAAKHDRAQERSHPNGMVRRADGQWVSAPQQMSWHRRNECRYGR